MCTSQQLHALVESPKPTGLPSMADKQYFQKNKCDITRCQYVSGPEAYCVSMSYDEESGMKTAEQFQNQSSNNILSLTRCESAAQNACFDVFLKSVLLLNHYGQAIKPSTVHCKMACATASGFTASSERATEIRRIH